ncbi:type VI secretion system ATPase TssH [Nautilia lithotrophica]
MIAKDLKSLLLHLNETMTKALHEAVGVAVSRGNYEITPEHMMYALIGIENDDFRLILNYFDVNLEEFLKTINMYLDDLKKGSSAKPLFSPVLLELFEDAWVISSIDLKEERIRSGAFLIAILNKLNNLSTYYSNMLEKINLQTLKDNFFEIVKGSVEESFKEAGVKGEGFINKFCIDFTKRAKEGKIDPVFGREKEIREIVDVLARRRKNNPIIVGEPGVGKTALVEGLALKIVNNEVPEVLQNTRLLGLDMGLLEAGASVRGEFQNRLKGVIKEIQSSEIPIILFIDEAHTLIGASKEGNDAANLLKPALARGELKTIAATTWKEYKKYFEKDAALARRFQLIKLNEPSVDDTVMILRGLKKSYEKAHNVFVSDEAIVACARLSDKYISGRFLPDKAIDLLDTSCARVKVSMHSTPAEIEDLQKEIESLTREKEALERDKKHGIKIDDEELKKVNKKLDELNKKLKSLQKEYEKQKTLVNKILNEKDEKQLKKLKKEYEKLENPMIFFEVTSDTVAKVVSEWTGIPLGKMLKDESKILLELEERLKEQVKGQERAHKVLAEILRFAKSGLKDPDKPLGVFLFVGPSGVGKTETGLVLADILFGSRKNVVTINMSEYQEGYTVSKLIGSPPGYVGYGEGGILTEAVRKQPYSVVLLDEIEKAHKDVLELFYQVFDKGVLSDGEGKEINFKNTIIILTSNLASDVIEDITQKKPDISVDELRDIIKPYLLKKIEPALLGRITVVPFVTLSDDALKEITKLKLNKIAKRLSAQKIRFEYSDEVVDEIVRVAKDVKSGARNIDYIINTKVMPLISKELLLHMADNKMPKAVKVGLNEDKTFNITFE